MWGPNELAARWIPALQDGLWHAGRTIDPAEVSVCFCGDLFRRDPERGESETWDDTKAGVEDALRETLGENALSALTELVGRQTYERTVDMFTSLATQGEWPGSTSRWVNVVALTDPVTRPGRVPERFGSKVEERLVDNGHRAHHPESYLNSRAVGEVVAEALRS